jgi:hypothetical protein
VIGGTRAVVSQILGADSAAPSILTDPVNGVSQKRPTIPERKIMLDTESRKKEKRSFKNRSIPKLEFGNEKGKPSSPREIPRSEPDWRCLRARDDIVFCFRNRMLIFENVM